jgi:hypothetical protein
MCARLGFYKQALSDHISTTATYVFQVVFTPPVDSFVRTAVFDISIALFIKNSRSALNGFAESSLF